MEQSNRRLDSWKEIADYLDRDIRTVTRWEKEKALPVHRVPGGKRSAVFAYSAEIDAWLVSQSQPEAAADLPDPTGPSAEIPSRTKPAEPRSAGMGRLRSGGVLWSGGLTFLLVAVAVILVRGWDTSSSAGPEPLEQTLNLVRNDYEAISPRGLAAEDFNSDKKMDLVFSETAEGRVAVLLGDGHGSFQGRVLSTTVPNPERIAAADFNGDGRMDIAVTSYFGGSEMEVLLGNGDGTFRSRYRHDVGGRSRWVVTSDLNRDGQLDVVISASNAAKLIVLFGEGDGTFREAGRYDAERDVAGLVAADFDGDGFVDLAATDYRSATGASVSFYRNKGNGELEPPRRFEAGPGPLGLAAADLNQDGRTDLVTANFPVSASVLLNAGSGGFAPPQSLEAGRGNGYVEAADINRDGKLDLVVLGEHSNTVSVLIGKGDGTFAPRLDFPAGSYPDTAAVVDLDGDKKLDIVTANINGNSISVLLNRTPQVARSWIRRFTRSSSMIF